MLTRRNGDSSLVDENDTVVYAQQVPENSREPDYAPALAAAGKK